MTSPAGDTTPRNTTPRRLTAAELAFVEELIADAEGTDADIARVLGPDHEASAGLKGARDFLRAVRDTGVLMGGQLSEGAREIVDHALAHPAGRDADGGTP